MTSEVFSETSVGTCAAATSASRSPVTVLAGGCLALGEDPQAVQLVEQVILAVGISQLDNRFRQCNRLLAAGGHDAGGRRGVCRHFQAEGQERCLR